MASGDTKTDQYLDIAANGTRADLPTDTCCETRTQSLIRGVAERIIGVEEEVQELENNPDVVDIVATYQDLQNYDTSGLTDKDIIRVLEDSTHDNNSTYYRWNASTNQFDFVGEISGGSSVNVVQTTGTSTTDVMSQNAVTSMVFADPSMLSQVRIGLAAGVTGSNALGIGNSCRSTGTNSIALGYEAFATHQNSTAIGRSSQTTRVGEVNVGAGVSNRGFNSTSYRVLGGVHDPVDNHDAATKGYVDGLVGDIETALNVINNGTGA